MTELRLQPLGPQVFVRAVVDAQRPLPPAQVRVAGPAVQPHRHLLPAPGFPLGRQRVAAVGPKEEFKREGPPVQEPPAAQLEGHAALGAHVAVPRLQKAQLPALGVNHRKVIGVLRKLQERRPLKVVLEREEERVQLPLEPQVRQPFGHAPDEPHPPFAVPKGKGEAPWEQPWWRQPVPLPEKPPRVPLGEPLLGPRVAKALAR